MNGSVRWNVEVPCSFYENSDELGHRFKPVLVHTHNVFSVLAETAKEAAKAASVKALAAVRNKLGGAVDKSVGELKPKKAVS